MAGDGDEGPLRIGVSACLAGRRVRYDGDHRRDAVVTGVLAASAQLVEVCPEVEVGLGVPRQTLHLVAVGGGVRLRTTDGTEDHTEAMARFAEARIEALADAGLDGFVLKARSPSCGVGSVPIAGGEPGARTHGRFADALARALPHLPVVESEWLGPPERLERFLAWARAHRRWRELAVGGLDPSALLDYHRRVAGSLGREVGRVGDEILADLARPPPSAADAVAARYRSALTSEMRRELAPLP